MSAHTVPFVERLLQRSLGRSRYHYAGVVLLLVRRELKVKYRGTVLGYLWSMLNPLLFMVVVSFVFSHFTRGVAHYGLFILSGILCWNMVSGIIVQGTHSILGGSHLIRKVRLPIWIFPLVPVGSCTINLVLALLPYAALMLAEGVSLTPAFAAFPLVLCLLAIFLCGIALTLATLNVFFRDVAHVLEPVLALAFYATPVIYDRRAPMIPPNISQLLLLNPFTHFVEAFRACLLGNAPLLPHELLILAALALLSAGVGSLVYRTASRKIIFSL